MNKMTRRLVILILAVALDTGQSADLVWQPLCDQEQGSQLYIDADIMTSIKDKEELTVIVSNKRRDVSVKCVSQVQGEEAVEEVVTRANVTTIWEKQDTKFWKAEHKVQCGCQVTIVDVKEGAAFQSQCSSPEVTTGAGSIVCVVTNWLETAFQAKHGKCPEEEQQHAATFEFQLLDQETDTWSSCEKLDRDQMTLAQNRDEDVSFLNCSTLSGGSPGGSLVVRMIKTHKSAGNIGLAFLKSDPDCQESSYIMIDNHDGEYEDYTYIIVGLSVGCGVLIIVITVALLCVYLRKRNTQKAEREAIRNISDNTDHMLLSTLERNNFYVSADDGSFQRQCSVKDDANRKASERQVTKEVKMEMIKESLISGDNSRTNTSLPKVKQTSALHYDRRYERDLDSFTVGYILGEGMFGTVYLGEARNIYGPQTTKVAVKQVKDVLRADDSQMEAVIMEMKIMSNLKMHPNLVNLLGACTSELCYNKISLLLEYCPYGDLKQFLVEHRSQFESALRSEPGHLESQFNSGLLLEWSHGIARGLDYLTSASIMHGDLAARNVLIGENYVAKISDFGLSKMMYYNTGYKKTPGKLVPYAWMAIEYLKTGEFNLKSDVWSFGVTLWEIFSLGNKPYGFDPYEETKLKILDGQRLETPEFTDLIDHGDTVYREVMLRCWEARPEARPSTGELVTSLRSLLGAEAEYEVMLREYMDTLPLIHRGTGDSKQGHEDKTPEASSGYIQMSEAVSGGQDVSPYIQVSEMPEVSKGYSVHTMSPGGYITLTDMKS